MKTRPPPPPPPPPQILKSLSTHSSLPSLVLLLKILGRIRGALRKGNPSSPFFWQGPDSEGLHPPKT